MVKTVLYVLGIVLVLVGLLGFVNDPVLGIFEVDALQNSIHLITGIALVVAASLGGGVGSLVVKILAVIYALMAVLGLVLPGDTLLGLMEINFAGNIFHLVLAALFIWLGFFGSKEKSAESMTSDTPPPSAPSAPSAQPSTGGETYQTPPPPSAPPSTPQV